MEVMGLMVSLFYNVYRNKYIRNKLVNIILASSDIIFNTNNCWTQQLGEFVDEYTVRVIDVFAMPQSGTGVSVEAVDPVFQARMLDMLRQTGRPEMVVGWYHSHPGFGK